MPMRIKFVKENKKALCQILLIGKNQVMQPGSFFVPFDDNKGSTLFGTDEFSSVPFLYMMTIKKDNYPKKYTHGNCPKKGIKSS